MKKVMSLILALVMLISITACSNNTSGNGSTNPSSGAAPNENPSSGTTPSNVTISIGSGTSGGAFYMVGAALAQTIQKYTGYTANSEATGGTSENLRLVSEESTTIGMGMCDDIISAYEGRRDYEGEPADNLRVLMAGQTNTFHIIVRADSDIYTLEDLAGKRISLGPSGAPYFGPDMLEAAVGFVNGKDYTGQYLGHDQAADALQNGDIDVIICTVAYPSSAYANLALSIDVRFIDLTEAQMQAVLAAHPAWKNQGVAAGAYEGLTKDTYTPSVPVWLFTYADMEDDVIYNICKSILEHSEELSTIHADAGKYVTETATEGVGDSGVPMHPGAIRYFEEAGVM